MLLELADQVGGPFAADAFDGWPAEQLSRCTSRMDGPSLAEYLLVNRGYNSDRYREVLKDTGVNFSVRFLSGKSHNSSPRMMKRAIESVTRSREVLPASLPKTVKGYHQSRHQKAVHYRQGPVREPPKLGPLTS